MNVNFEPIIRGLKSDIFQKRKSGVKKCLEIMTIKGGGGGGGLDPNGKKHLKIPF